MGLLNFVKCYKFFLVALFYIVLLSCNNAKKNGHIEVEKSPSTYFKRSLLDSSSWSFGFHPFCISKNGFLLAYLINDSTLRIIDSKDTNNFVEKKFYGEALAVYAYNKSVSMIFNDKIMKLEFGNDIQHYQSSVTTCEKIANDTLLYFPYIYSGVVPLSEDSILIPYRLSEREVNPTDSTSYLLLIKKQNIWGYAKKIVKYPNKYNSYREYLLLPLASYSSFSKALYYSFQKQPFLYRLNIDNNKLDSSTFFKLDTISFNGKSCSNVGYIRKYILSNDCISKILCTDNYVYVLIKRKKGSKFSFKLLVFDLNLKILAEQDISEELSAEFSFIFNNKLYVKSSHDFYYIYSYSIK